MQMCNYRHNELKNIVALSTCVVNLLLKMKSIVKRYFFFKYHKKQSVSCRIFKPEAYLTP